MTPILTVLFFIHLRLSFKYNCRYYTNCAILTPLLTF
jgi:hypothetical protein